VKIFSVRRPPAKIVGPEPQDSVQSEIDALESRVKTLEAELAPRKSGN
jgi:hypothetical protein